MQTAIEIPPALGLEATAARLGKCRRTIERMIRQGDLATIKPNARCVLVLVSSIEEWEARIAGK